MVKEFLGQRRMDEMLSLGEANAEVLRQLDRWCKHLEATLTAAGMLAEMSGLPIGSFRLSCPHATYIPDAMNLPWSSRDFLDHNCRNCPHHKPDGDPRWGHNVLAQIDTSRTEAARHEAEMHSAIEEVRKRCREQAGQGRKEDNLTEHQILTWAEQIFDGEAGTIAATARHLAEAAKVAPDLFGPTVVEAFYLAAPTKAFHEAALPVLAELAGRREDLDEKLTATALAGLKAGVGLEHACAILTKTRREGWQESRGHVIDRVVAMRDHIRPFGGWPTRDPECELVDIPPDYTLSNVFLAQEYDREAEAVLSVIREAVRSPDANRRINACGVADGLIELRPQAAIALAPDVATCLELLDNEFGESADGAATDTLAKAFLIEPEAIDDLLAGRIESRSPPIQKQLIDVYEQVLRSKEPWFPNEDEVHRVASEDGRMSAAVAVAIRRVLRLLQDEELDVEPLLEVVEAVKTASRLHPQQMIEHHAVLLGTLAGWSLQKEARPAPPAIEIPGVGPKPPELQAMDKYGRDTRWKVVKRELGDALSELVEANPDRFADTLISSFENLDSKTHSAFKGEVTRFFGVLGKQHALLPRVLPTLWTALMDQSSAAVRHRALGAIDECFGWPRQPPPSDIVDVIVLHLSDRSYAVHQTAVQVVGDHASWLTEEQAIQTLTRLGNLIHFYKKEDPYRLESIADALLSVSRRVPRGREWAVNEVLTLLPSGNALVDEQLVERLIRGVRPAEPAARVVARTVLRWVGGDGRHADDYHDKANEGFSWLHGLTPELFGQVRALAVEKSRTAANDPRRALSFASLFASHQDYEGERGILMQARSHLPAGRRYEELGKTMGRLADAARRNASRSGAGDS